MKSMKSNIKKLDMIGVPVKLKYMGSATAKTVWGGLLTTVLALVMGLLVVTMGINLFSRSSLLVNQSSKMEEEASVDISKFPIVVYFTDIAAVDLTTNPVFMESIEFSATFFISFTPEGEVMDTIIYKIGLTRCTDEMAGEYLDEFKKVTNSMDLSWCLDTSKIYNLYTGEKADPQIIVKNTFGSVNSAYLSFDLNSCDETKNPGCFDKIQTLGPVYMGVAFVDSYVDVTDFADPIKSRISFNSHPIATSFSFRRYFSLKINEIVTDGDLIFSYNTNELFISKGSERMSVDLYSPQIRHISSMVFDVDQLKLTINRKYPKIQDLLASIGGLAKIAFMFAQLFNFHFSEYTLLKGLNDHLEKRIVKLSNSSVNQRIEFDRNRSRKEESVDFNNAVPRVQRDKENNQSSDVINSIKSLKPNISFSFLAYLYSLLSCGKKSSLSFRKIELEQYMDILFIAERLETNKET